jgi:baseplate structural protein gp10
VFIYASSAWAPINPNAFTLNGTALDFASAPASGTNNIFVYAPSLLLGAASAAAAAAATSETNAAASAASAEAATVLTAADVVSANAAAAAAASSAAAASGMPCAAAGGTSDAITATYSPAITLVDQRIVSFVASAANTTTTPTFAPNGLTAHTITKNGGQPLVAGNIAGALAVYFLEYNSAHTRWELLNPTVAVPSLSAAWPINSLYFSTVNTNPATSLGFGTWSAYAQGLVIVGAGTGTDSNSVSQTFTAGTQVGEYKHTLTAGETPVLSGTVSGGTTNTASNTGNVFSSGPYATAATATYTASVNSGGGGTHNNVQPSIPVYIWQRTA